MFNLRIILFLFFITPKLILSNFRPGNPVGICNSNGLMKSLIKQGPKTGFSKWDDDDPFAELSKGQWWFWGNSVVSTSQAQFSNWQYGGENSIAISTSLSLNLTYFSDQLNWETYFNAGYGIMLQGKEGQWFKNDDRLELSTKFGLRANEQWFYTGLLYFGSQFQPGYYNLGDDKPISEFMAPGYVMGSLGFDYAPSQKLSIFFGPVTSKNTIVLNQDLANQGAYGVEPGAYDYLTGEYLTLGKKFRSEAGGLMRVEYNEPRIVKNVGLYSRLVLFSNYIENPGNIDVDFENTFNLQVNEFITTNLILHFIYDDDIKIALDESGERTGPRLQFKQVLAVGLNINIGSLGY